MLCVAQRAKCRINLADLLRALDLLQPFGHIADLGGKVIWGEKP